MTMTQQEHDAAVVASLEAERTIAEVNAWKALAGYKFQMFGYWCGIWVHLNKICRFSQPNPWREAVQKAKTELPRLVAAEALLKAQPLDENVTDSGE